MNRKNDIRFLVCILIGALIFVVGSINQLKFYKDTHNGIRDEIYNALVFSYNIVKTSMDGGEKISDAKWEEAISSINSHRYNRITKYENEAIGLAISLVETQYLIDTGQVPVDEIEKAKNEAVSIMEALEILIN